MTDIQDILDGTRTSGQFRVDPLDFEDEQGLTPEAARRQALSVRNMLIRQIKKAQPRLSVRGWTLTGQLRQYRSFGVPDGRVRPVYYINVQTK